MLSVFENMGILTLLFSCSSRIHRNHSPALITIQPSFLAISCKTLNNLIKSCYPPTWLPPHYFAGPPIPFHSQSLFPIPQRLSLFLATHPSICHTSETPWGRGPSPALRLSSRTRSRDPQASLIPRVTSYEISRRPSPFCSATYKMLFAQLPCLDKDPSFMGGTRVRVATLLPWRVFGDFHDAFAFQ